MQLSLAQKISSYFYPAHIRSGSTAVNPVLQLLYFRGRWQLGTPDALYSDGHRYRPLVSAFRELGEKLEHIRQVLVLGTGLGSAVDILDRLGHHPHFTLVELDSTVLEWALEIMRPDIRKNINPVCADALQFMEEAADNYDLIIVDVFRGRQVPAFVTTAAFLQLCRRRLGPKGSLVLNYMVNEPADEAKAKAALGAAFIGVKEISFHINRVYVATT